MGPTENGYPHGISKAPILLVGVGGIGCEVAIQLAKLNFTNITLVDFDHVERSNRSRQLLHCRSKEGTPKTDSAVASLYELYNVRLFSLSCSLNEVPGLERFSLYIGALDNYESRSMLNRFSLLYNVPYIDVGSSGYLAQSIVYFPGHTSCYECGIVHLNDTINYCTLRGSPRTAEQCVIWAREYLLAYFNGSVCLKDAPKQTTDRLAGFLSAVFYLFGIEERIGTKERVVLNEIETDEAAKMDTLSGLKEYKEGLCDVCKRGADTRNKEGNLDEEQKRKRSPEYLLVEKELSRHRLTTLECVGLRKDSFSFSCFLIWAVALREVRKCAEDLLFLGTTLRCMMYGIDPLPRYRVSGIANRIVPSSLSVNAIAASFSTKQALELLENAKREKKEAERTWMREHTRLDYQPAHHDGMEHYSGKGMVREMRLSTMRAQWEIERVPSSYYLLRNGHRIERVDPQTRGKGCAHCNSLYGAILVRQEITLREFVEESFSEEVSLFKENVCLYENDYTRNLEARLRGLQQESRWITVYLGSSRVILYVDYLEEQADSF